MTSQGILPTDAWCFVFKYNHKDTYSANHGLHRSRIFQNCFCSTPLIVFVPRICRSKIHQKENVARAIANCLSTTRIISRRANLLLGLEVVEEDGALLRLLSPVLDDNARAVDNLAGVTFTVENACEKY
jgi:hypothetical protein